MGTQHRRIRHSLLVCTLAGAALAPACGSDTGESAVSAEESTIPGSPATTPGASTSSSPTSTDRAPTTAPASTGPTEPVPLREGLILTAGWPYASTNLRVPVTFTAPDDEVLGRWRSLFDTSNYLILTLQQQDKRQNDVVREESGVSFYVLPDEVTSEQFVEAWTAYASEQESFTVDIGEGEYLGQPATVISGTYELGDPLDGAFFMRLDHGMSVPVASGERRYLSYLVPVGDDTVVVRLNAHELDWDLNVTLVNQIVESLEFR